MRTLILSAILAVLIPAAIARPWIGILGWTWLGLMNPHRMTWGFLVHAPVAAAVGGATLVGLLFTRERRMPPVNAMTVVLLLLVLWMCVTTLFAVYPQASLPMFNRVIKIQLMIFVTLALLYTRVHLQWLIWVVALSLAFFGVKGGLYTIATAGVGRVWGPPGGFIEGNNEIGLALIMTIPLLHYLRSQIANKWGRRALVAAMLLCALSVLGTQSRGAFLAICAIGAWMWWRSPNKIVTGTALAVLAVAMLAFMPGSWEERMRSIQHYEQDTSAMGRINAWVMAWRLASDRLLGAGFEVITPELFARYAPDPGDIHAAHSIYFQMLGEHGFIGLGLFLLLFAATWRSTSWIARHAPRAGMPDLAALAITLQVSFVGYFVGGAFLSLAYFDLPYIMVAMTVIARALVEERLRDAGSVADPGAARVQPASATGGVPATRRDGSAASRAT